MSAAATAGRRRAPAARPSQSQPHARVAAAPRRDRLQPPRPLRQPPRLERLERRDRGGLRQREPRRRLVVRLLLVCDPVPAKHDHIIGPRGGAPQAEARPEVGLRRRPEEGLRVGHDQRRRAVGAARGRDDRVERRAVAHAVAHI